MAAASAAARWQYLAHRRLGTALLGTIALKTGVSSSFERVHRPKATSSRTAEGHPPAQALNCSSVSVRRAPRVTRWPAGFRRRADLGGGGVESRALRVSELAGQQHRPPHSPPPRRPGRSGAAPGRRGGDTGRAYGAAADHEVLTPITTSVAISTFLRPMTHAPSPKTRPRAGGDYTAHCWTTPDVWC